MLPDSAHIQEAEAERASRRIQSAKPGKLSPSDAVPAYTMQDAVDCLQQLHPVAYDTDVVPHADVRCRFRDAGHILGSAILEIWVREGETTTKLVMSGDLGQPGRPILRDPTVIEEADVLFIESTYGDRAHKDQVATMEELVQVLEHTLPHGNVIVPAFAVGRTQEVLYHLHRLTSEGRLRNLNIYVDSPMAAAATRITMKYLALFDEAARSLEHWRAAGKNLPSLRFTASVEESMALNRIRAGAIVISASGMCNAGRIKHHLRHNLGRRECSVLITGFQAQGTLGRKLVDGAKQVSIFGEEIPVRAAIHTLGGFSAHAGQPALLAWAAGFKRPPRQTFVVHGEESAALAFAERLRSDRGWAVTVPAPGQSVSM
jgi:metallo-beta-lactamase family protein